MGLQQEGSCVMDDYVVRLLSTSDVNLGESGRVHIKLYIVYCTRPSGLYLSL